MTNPLLRLTPPALALLALAGMTSGTSAQAGCPCRGGNAGAPVLQPFPSTVTASPLPAYEMAPVLQPTPNQLQFANPGPQPPPGTLGRTYQMKSLPVPAKMHPRTGMIDVRIANAKEVLVHPMYAFRTEDALEGFQDAEDSSMWHFQSEPLIPGLPHIYRIEARIDGPNGQSMQERYVRLIMGRLIEVEF